MAIDARRTNRTEMRTDFPRLPRHGYCLTASITGHIEHDGCRRTIPRHGTAVASGQQGRNKYVD